MVHVTPLPDWARKTKFRPQPQPIFDGEPTRAEIELALALLAELDPESRAWYGSGAAERLRARLAGATST